MSTRTDTDGNTHDLDDRMLTEVAELARRRGKRLVVTCDAGDAGLPIFRLIDDLRVVADTEEVGNDADRNDNNTTMANTKK